MPDDTPTHKAIIDADGNVTVPPDDGTSRATGDRIQKTKAAFDSHREENSHEGLALDPEQEILDILARAEDVQNGNVRQHLKPVSIHMRQWRRILKQTLQEGTRQIEVSISETEPAFGEIRVDGKNLIQRLRQFLSQPVWVPGRKNTAKQYSRGTLFFIDIVRFGATFAGIFLILFVSLNYQSFWEIAKARLHGPEIESLSPSQDAQRLSTIQSIASNGGQHHMQGDLLSFLPPVGPPDNRLVIPKLNLNVPIVTPPSDALLRQDWTQVEADIQSALQKGVVYYPGTAHPGQAGNFFVTGHSSYYPWSSGQYKNVFARLQDLSVGDEYWVYFGGDKHRYVIRTKKEVGPSDTSVLDQPVNQRISTLMTCTPVGTSLRRLIVVAQEVDLSTAVALKVGQREQQNAQKVSLDMLPI